jgi:hypothetical protein
MHISWCHLGEKYEKGGNVKKRKKGKEIRNWEEKGTGKINAR